MFSKIFCVDFLVDAETASPTHGSHLSEVEKNNLTSSEMSENSPADAEMAEKKRLAAERRKKLLDQVRHGISTFFSNVLFSGQDTYLLYIPLELNAVLNITL